LRADDCCSALLALHAAAITRNLDCVLLSVDPEGPHQLRTALRRFRVVLRTLRPIMRAARTEPLTFSARRIGSIVGELRDADVLIDEMLGPAAARHGFADVTVALNDWRHEVRGRVRARLLSAEAPAFAAGLGEIAGSFDWRKRKRAHAHSAREIVAKFVERCGRRVAHAVEKLPKLPHEQVHDVRKEVKTLRYTIELADALSINADADLAPCLKRAQDALGFVNDIATLEGFDTPLVNNCARISELRQLLIAEQAQAVTDNIARAATRLRGIEDRCKSREWMRA
jgi:CHAD domain-containing protein